MKGLGIVALLGLAALACGIPLSGPEPFESLFRQERAAVRRVIAKRMAEFGHPLLSPVGSCGNPNCFRSLMPSDKMMEKMKGAVKMCLKSAINKTASFKKEMNCDDVMKIIDAGMKDDKMGEEMPMDEEPTDPEMMSEQILAEENPKRHRRDASRRRRMAEGESKESKEQSQEDNKATADEVEVDPAELGELDAFSFLADMPDFPKFPHFGPPRARMPQFPFMLPSMAGGFGEEERSGSGPMSIADRVRKMFGMTSGEDEGDHDAMPFGGPMMPPPFLSMGGPRRHRPMGFPQMTFIVAGKPPNPVKEFMKHMIKMKLKENLQECVVQEMGLVDDEGTFDPEKFKEFLGMGFEDPEDENLKELKVLVDECTMDMKEKEITGNIAMWFSSECMEPKIMALCKTKNTAEGPVADADAESFLGELKLMVKKPDPNNPSKKATNSPKSADEDGTSYTESSDVTTEMIDETSPEPSAEPTAEAEPTTD